MTTKVKPEKNKKSSKPKNPKETKKDKIQNKVLVVYYSRTGLTRKVSESICKKLGAQLSEIVDKKDRSGAMGYLIAGKDATQKKITQITYDIKPSDYGTIIIGGPVWAWTMSPAIRSYITENKDILKTKKLAFFATQGGDGAEKKFKAMQEIIGSGPAHTLIINSRDFRDGSFEKKIDGFVKSF